MTKQLIHYGVLGMHWGVTTKSSSSDSEDHKRSVALRIKRRNELSNDELKSLTSRLQLEKKHAELTKKELNFGEKFVANAVTNYGTQTIAALTALAAAKTVSALIDYIHKKSAVG